MHSNYIQLPPDGVGKQVIARKIYIIKVQSTTNFSIDQEIWNGVDDSFLIKKINPDANVLYCMYHNANNEGGSSSLFNINSTIYDMQGGVLGSVSSTTAPYFMYYNLNSTISFDNPYNGQLVDAEGQALVRFAEGSQLLDAKGISKQSQETPIGIYSYSSSASWFDNCSAIKSGTSNAEFNTSLPPHSIKLTTDTASGDTVTFTTNKWHDRPSGRAINITTKLIIGDAGKTNLKREWGYFDDNNGLFFRLDGTVLSIVRRTNYTGVVNDEVVTQTNWSDDTMDGTGISKEVIDINSLTTYWFDIYAGVRGRIGVYGKTGKRILLHTFTKSGVTVASSSLPIRITQTNTDSVISQSTMYLQSANIFCEGENRSQTLVYEGSGNIITNCTSAVWTPLFSIRPTTDSNHAILLPKLISISSTVNGDSTKDGRVKVEIFKNATLTGSNYNTIKTGSKFEYDKSSTAGSGGVAITEHFVKGTQNLELNQFFSYLDENLLETATGIKPTYTIMVKAILESCDVIGAMIWEEIQI